MLIVPIDAADPRMIDAAGAALSATFAGRLDVAPRPLDPAFAFHPERNQYSSTLLLERLRGDYPDLELVVGVTALDLFVPILTFVFGEAQLGGACAVVSYHRLRQEFYGLPADDALAQERLAKETIHEAGHTLGLTHCEDYDCVMSASHSVEWLDLKGRTLCRGCRQRFA